MSCLIAQDLIEQTEQTNQTIPPNLLTILKVDLEYALVVEITVEVVGEVVVEVTEEEVGELVVEIVVKY